MDAKIALDSSIVLPHLKPSTTSSILTVITPSPGAIPVEVTQQSQVVTSFIPEMTMCVGPPVGLFPVTTLGPPYFNQSTVFGTTVAGTGSCSTVYATTETTVCATVITGIASKMTVSNCKQDITFSSEAGYSLEVPTPVTVNNIEITPPPTLRRMVTYYAAPWQSVTMGEPPKDVEAKICTILDDGNLECESYEEVWQVNVVTVTRTSTSQVDLATTVSGPGLFMVNTIHINITTTYESVSLSTTMLLETEIEMETTSKSTRTATSPMELVESTAYITKIVKHASKAKPKPTTTVLVTSVATVSVGTITRTAARPFSALMDLVVDN
jgi:hypothetical protein